MCGGGENMSGNYIGSVKKSFTDFARRQPQICILLLLVVIFSLTLKAFTTGANILNMLKQSSILMLLSAGMTFVVITGNLDLSIGSTLSLLLCLSIRLQPNSIAMALIAPFLVAIVIGAFNGYIVGKFNVNSVIVSLAMMSAIAGITLIYTSGSMSRGVPDTAYSYLGTGKVFGIPVYVLIVLFVVIVFELILRKTTFGRNLYYYGVNSEAASVAGINGQFLMIMVFLISSLSVAMATILMGSRLLSASPVAGTGYELDAITAILIGGVSLDGGRGNIINTVIGVLLVTVIINGLTLLNVPFEYRNVVKGLLILTAILTDRKSRWSYE